MENQFEYLTDLEVSAIERFNADPVLADAVHKVILNTVYNQGVIKKGKKLDQSSTSKMNSAFVLASVACSGQSVVDDEALGRDLRALWRGIQLVNTGFNELAKIKKVVEKKEEDTNNAI